MKIKSILLNSIKLLKTSNFLLFYTLIIGINQSSFSMNYFWENNNNNERQVRINQQNTNQFDNNKMTDDQNEFSWQPFEQSTQKSINSGTNKSSFSMYYSNNNKINKQSTNQFNNPNEFNRQSFEQNFINEVENQNNNNNNINKNFYKNENKTLYTFLKGCKNKNILQTFFSPKDDIFTILTYLIKNESSRIRIAAYMLCDFDLIGMLANASKNGIDIEIISDNKNYIKDKQIEYLSKSGVKIFFTKSNVTMHNKFIVFESNINNQKFLFTGSYNFTRQAQDNYENVIILNDNNIIQQYYNEFNNIKNRCNSIILNEEEEGKQENKYDYNW